MNLLTKGLLALTGAALLGTPALAHAGTAFQGKDTTDYFRNAAGNWRMEVCDKEADGFGVHGDFDFHYNGEQQRFDETGGADSACDQRAPGAAGLQGLWRHRTVEERPAWNVNDIKGDWHTH